MAHSLVDSHCHLAGTEFADDLDAVIQRARDAGLAHAMVILAADDAAELARARVVAERWPDVRFCIGVHPHTAGRFAADADAAARAVEAAIAAQPLARGIGEIGLDYHYDLAPRDVQQQVFRAQIRLARRRRLPVVIHTREAEEDTFAILADESDGELRGVVHCFTGDRDMMRRALDIGLHVSLAGIVTFPRAVELHEVAKLVPLERLLVETDSPYLAPVPFRGRRNEPAHVTQVAARIAELRGVEAARVAAATSGTFHRLFDP